MIEHLIGKSDMTLSLCNSVLLINTRCNTTGKFLGNWLVLNDAKDRFMHNEGVLNDPTYRSLDIMALPQFRTHLNDSTKKQADQTIIIVLCPKSVRTKPRETSSSPAKSGPGGGSGSGSKRKANKISKENDHPNSVIEIADDDDDNDDAVSSDEGPIIRTRFFICNGPMIEGVRLIRCPNTLDKAQGDWSEILKIPASLLYCNSSVSEMLVQYAGSRVVDFSLYDPYRASTVIKGISSLHIFIF